MILIYSVTLKFCLLALVKTCRTKTFLTQSDLILRARMIFSFKVILREIIRNDDTALPYCWDIVSNVYNIVATSQSCVDCKTFRIFAYSSTREQSNKRCGTRLKTESETGERLFSPSPHTPYGRVRLARFARIRVLRHALPISLLILRKKPTVLQSKSCVVLKIVVANRPV